MSEPTNTREAGSLRVPLAITSLALFFEILPLNLFGLALHGRPIWRVIYGVFTYSFTPVGLGLWAWHTLFILLAAVLLRRVVGSKHFLVLALTGALVGGAAHLLLFGLDVTVAGLGAIATAFSGAAILYAIWHWKSVELGWRVYTVILVLALLSDPRVSRLVITGAGVATAAVWSRQWERPDYPTIDA